MYLTPFPPVQMKTFMVLKGLLICALAAASISSCAALGTPSMYAPVDVEDVSNAMDMQVISVRGYIKTDVLGATYLYANRENADSERVTPGLDVIFSNNKIQKRDADFDIGFCAVVEGVFEIPKDDKIYLGSFSSKTGLIRPAVIRHSSCQNN